jgi:DNA-binding XRE family transcriptional regulator
MANRNFKNRAAGRISSSDKGNRNQDSEGVRRSDISMIGHVVRSLRVERHWSIERLAQQANLSKSALHHIEAGDAEPRLTSIIALAEAFGEPIEDIVERARRASKILKVSRHLPSVIRKIKKSSPITPGVIELSNLNENPQIIARIINLRKGQKAELLALCSGKLAAVFCYILDGNAVFTAKEGVPDELTAGDALHAVAKPREAFIGGPPAGARMLCVVTASKKLDR